MISKIYALYHISIMVSLASYIISILHHLFLLCIFLSRLVGSTSSYPSMEPLCHAEERMALLRFREGFEILKTASHGPSAYPKIQSWKLQGDGSTDCCSWDGVYCDQQTGHVDIMTRSISWLMCTCLLSGPLKEDLSETVYAFMDRIVWKAMCITVSFTE